MRYIVRLALTGCLAVLAIQDAQAQSSVDHPKTTAAAAHAKVVGEDAFVPFGDGLQIFVRNRRPAGVTHFASDRIAILMHGGTWPSTSFDVPLGGKSWMDYMAECGFDVYALDLPGYGRSTRPAVMDLPAQENPPFMGGPEAVAALGAVVDYVLKRRSVSKVNLVGWSWGTAITAAYATESPDKVDRLALYAPLWLRTTPSTAQAQAQRKLGAYRVVSRDQVLARWLMGVPDDKKASLIPSGWFDKWADVTFATDPKGEGKTLRAPNGVVEHVREYWFATPPKAYWDPAKTTSPVLLVVGEWDRETPPYMAQTLFPLLVNAPWKRLTVLSEGTHTMLMERNRMLLFRTVQQFFEEPPPKPTAMR